MSESIPRGPSWGGVWHKDGAIAQIEAMARWAEHGRTGDGISAETAGKIADNLDAAVKALRETPA